MHAVVVSRLLMNLNMVLYVLCIVGLPGLVGGESDDVLSAVGMWEDPGVVAEEASAQSLEYLNLEEKFSHIHLEVAQGGRTKTEFLTRSPF